MAGTSAGSSEPTLRARVYYDFASTLCYVAHRVFAELEPDLAALGIALEWQPLDLSELLGWPRGVLVDEARLSNAERVAAEFGVAVRPLPVWPDSREALAAVLALGRGPRSEAFRERVFAAAFEERIELDAPDVVARCARDLGIVFDPRELEDARAALEVGARRASDEGVTGLPTIMLDTFPFPGVQSRQTTLLVLERWARGSRAAKLVG